MLGGALYGALEMLWRGRTHPSMLLAGGACLCAISFADENLTAPFAWKALLGGLIITAVELLVGILVNRLLSLNVWDYSKIPGNLWGQICPRYIFFWVLLSIPAIWLCRGLNLLWHLPN